MTKFKKGDVVKRVGHGYVTTYHGMCVGDTDTVVGVHPGVNDTDMLSLDKFGDGHSSRFFELVNDDPLPDAPTDVLYIDQYTAVTGRRSVVRDGAGVRVRLSPYEASLISVSVGGSCLWSRLDADSALQLAHDLRRMAMELKRKEKLNA